MRVDHVEGRDEKTAGGGGAEVHRYSVQGRWAASTTCWREPEGGTHKDPRWPMALVDERLRYHLASSTRNRWSRCWKSATEVPQHRAVLYHRE